MLHCLAIIFSIKSIYVSQDIFERRNHHVIATVSAGRETIPLLNYIITNLSPNFPDK